MLRFIFGDVGSGKTTRIYDIVKSLLEAGESGITLLVPEQFTFTCQKNMLAVLGAEKTAGVDVLSFTQLGEKTVGKPAFYRNRRLSDTGAAAIMSLTLKDVSGSLKVYGKSAEKPSAVKEFLSLSAELKQNLVSPEALGEAAEKMEPCLLKAKLEDISLILKSYNERLGKSYFDPEDLLEAAVASASLSSYFSGRRVFIDSFRGFTAGEYAVIERILASAREVYVSLCAPGESEENDVTEFFAKTQNTAARISRLAEEQGVERAKPVYTNISELITTPDPELAHLAASLRAPAPLTYEGEVKNIALCRASTRYMECEYVAASIKKLIREEGYRYRDIAVIARNIDDYRVPLTSALKKYGIKVYEDYRKSPDVSPVMNVLSAAARACADNMSNESVIRLIKTGLTGLTTEEISLVENYCYTWRISGKKWLNEWTANPDGFVSPEYVDEEETGAKLEKLNALRELIITPVSALKQALSGGVDGKAAVEALWKFLGDVNLAENVKAMASSLAFDGEDGAVLELKRSWTLLTDLLDELYGLLGGEKVTAKSLADLIDLMLGVQTVGNIPQGLDDITIGSADRIRLSSPRAAFVIGANEGVFPPEIKKVSSLTVKDRAKLEKYGITLGDSGEWKIAEENLIAYCSLCCPKEKLFVTCACADADGSELPAGDFYKKIQASFPSLKEQDAGSLGGLFYSESSQPAFEQLAKSEPGEFRETLSEYFSAREDYSGKIAALQRAAGGRNFKIFSPQIARELFGENMYISPSRIEQYYRCAFSYFCKYGLKANPRKQAELDVIQMGNVNHKVLETMLRENSKEELCAMDDGQIRSRIKEIMDEYLVEVLGSPEDPRFLYLYSRLGDTLLETVKKLIAEFSESSFEPADFELTIGFDGEIPAYIPEGSAGVYINGKVDRVDLCEDGGNKYFRIVDYKSSKKDFELADAVYGLNLQMLVYLFAIWQNGGKKYGKNISPAGVLYYNTADKTVSFSPGDSEEDALRDRLKAGRMTGLVLSDSRVISLMESKAEGLFIPASIDPKSGNIKGSVLNLEGFKSLKRRTDKLISEMASMLRSGEISALPYKSKSGEFKNCSYCDYKAVCGFENTVPARVMPEFKKDEVKENLENGGDGIGNKVE